MRTTVFFLFLVLCSPLLLCAQRKKSLIDKALDLKFQRRFDVALRYLKKSFKKEPDDRDWCLNYMGDIENKRGNVQEAESSYKSILSNYKNDNYYLLYRVHLKLADLYIEKRDFKGALDYLRGSEEYKYLHGCGTGKYDQEYELSYKYALCYDGLNQSDSAIKKLSRFMFKDDLLLTKRNTNRERTSFYYRLLVNKYGVCEVQDEILKAISNLYYLRGYDSARYRDLKVKSITCSLNLFGQTIPIADFGYGGLEEHIDEYYSKEVFLDGIRKSFLYGLIIAGI